VSQATNTDNTHGLARSCTPVLEWGVDSDSSTQQRCNSGKVKALGDVVDEVLSGHDFLGISALSDLTWKLRFWLAISEAWTHGTCAIVLIVVDTVLTFTAAIHDDANANGIADLVLGHSRTNFKNGSDNLVTRNEGVGTVAPFTTNGVNI
jgi:hypothetical protein